MDTIHPAIQEAVVGWTVEGKLAAQMHHGKTLIGPAASRCAQPMGKPGSPGEHQKGCYVDRHSQLK